MKRVFLLCMFCVFFGLNIQAQNVETLAIDWVDTTKNQSFDDFLEVYFNEVDFSKLNSNVFYGGVVPYSQIHRFEGKQSDSTMSEDNFWQLYHELRLATKHTPFLPPPDTLKFRITKYYKTNGYAPLIILDVEYDVFDKNALQNGSLVHLPQKPGLKTTNNGNPFEKKKLFCSNALFQNRFAFGG